MFWSVKMNPLELYELDTIDYLINDEHSSRLNLDSSALEIFTDFSKVEPLVIDSNAKAVDVEDLIKKTQVKLNVVLDSSDEFVGLLSYDNLSSQRIIQLVASGVPRNEIRVADVMIERNTIKALDYEQLVYTNIGGVVDTLQKNGLQHCLVIDVEQRSIRGIISSSEIARKLHLSIPIFKQPSFVDIFHAIRH